MSVCKNAAEFLRRFFFVRYTVNTMVVPEAALGNFLIDARSISRADFERARADAHEKHTPLFEHLQQQRLVSEDELTRAAAHALGVPFKEISHDEIMPEALLLLPEPLSRAHSLTIFKIEENTAHVALLSLDALSHVRFLEDERHMRVLPRLTDRASIKRALIAHQRHLKEAYAKKLARAEPGDALDALLSHALLSRAHQIYLEVLPGAELRVRYRVHGSLIEAMHLPTQAMAIVSAVKECAGFSFTLNAPQEGRFKLTLKNGEQVRVGAYSLYSTNGESTMLTLVKETSGQKGFTLESLGMHGEGVASVHELIAQRSGLVLVAAPPHHGKTTALYTMLDLSTVPHALSLSVEERVELEMPSVTQVEVKKELGATLASALRAALKHNPNVLLVSELSNEDTATLAASGAGRGMLVLAGIEAASASEAIERVLSWGVDPLLVASVLRGVVASRVVRKLCPLCKEKRPIHRRDIEAIETRANLGRVLAALKAEEVVEQSLQWKDVQQYVPVGCTECEEGYQGTAALFEVLSTTAVTKELIQSEEEKRSVVKADIPLLLAEDGMFKVAEGITSIEEVQRVLNI